MRLYSALQEHALRVMRVVEKVVGRLDNQEKARKEGIKEGKKRVKEYALRENPQPQHNTFFPWRK